MNNAVVESLSDYFSEIDSWRKEIRAYPMLLQGTFLFRGECEAFDLPCHSSMSRYIHQKKSLNQPDIQKEISALKHWVTQSRFAEKKRYPTDHWEQLMWARHHGLYTRLTDWSLNPLAALWFACDDENVAERKEGKVYVCADYTYRVEQIVNSPIQSDDSYVIEHKDGRTEELDSLFVHPPNNFNRRISNQSAVFHSSTNCVKSALDNHSRFTEISIPARAKPELIGSLSACNINTHTLGLSTPDNIAQAQNSRFFK